MPFVSDGGKDHYVSMTDPLDAKEPIVVYAQADSFEMRVGDARVLLSEVLSVLKPFAEDADFLIKQGSTSERYVRALNFYLKLGGVI